jgi:uncharacterized protein
MHDLSLTHYLLLLGVSMAAGMANGIAGGGSFMTFPALVLMGLSAVEANATSTVALWFGALANVWVYRSELVNHDVPPADIAPTAPGIDRQSIQFLALVSLLGGALGVALVLVVAERTFAQVVPYLMLFATGLFALSPRLTKWLRNQKRPIHLPFFLVLLLQFAIAIYGGYFGGGAGILMLATMNFMGLTNVNAMNGLKSLLGNCMNGVAIGAFIMAQKIVWWPAIVMALGAIAGTYISAQIAQQVPEKLVRYVIITIACAMTLYLFSRL